MEGVTVAKMWVDGGQCSQQGVPPPQPWASDSLSPTTAGPPASSSTSQQTAQAQHSRHRRREGQRERDRGKEKERPPPSPRGFFFADPERPLPPPPPSWHSWAKEGKGGAGVREGAVGPHTPLPTLGPCPPLPPLPALGGLRTESQTPQGAGRPFPQRGGTQGGRMNGDPPGSRDARQAGGGRAEAGAGDCGGPPDMAGWMLVPPSLCPSRAAPLWAALRPGGRC